MPRLKIPLLGPNDLVPQFEAPSFLQQVASDAGGVDDTLSSVDSLLSAAAAPMALEDGLLGGFLSDLGTDTPAVNDFQSIDPSPLVSQTSAFTGQGDTLHSSVTGRLSVPAPPALDYLPGGEVGKALAMLQAELEAKFGGKQGQ